MQTPYATLEVVSRHFSTTTPPSYAVRKELKLPGPESLDDMHKAKQIQTYRTLFVDNLAPGQRLYNVSLEMFRWPTRLYIDSEDTRVYLDNGRTGLGFVITSPIVPSKILFHMEYDFRCFMKKRLPIVSSVDARGNRTEVDLDPDWEEDEEESY